MTGTELKLWAAASRLMVDLDRCNPEVGFGPTPLTLLRDLQSNIGVYLTVEEENAVLMRARLEDG